MGEKLTRYDKARRMFEALELLAELEDQVDLDAERLALMRNPTRAQAATLYEAGIQLWMQENGPRFQGHPLVDAALGIQSEGEA